MEHIYTVNLNHEKDVPLNACTASISMYNVLAVALKRLQENSDEYAQKDKTKMIFSSCTERHFYGLYIIPLQRPYNVVLVDSCFYKIVHLCWTDDGMNLFVMNSNGTIRVLHMINGCCNAFETVVTYRISDEVVSVRHFTSRSKLYMSVDKRENGVYALEKLSKNLMGAITQKKSSDGCSSYFVCVTTAAKVYVLSAVKKISLCRSLPTEVPFVDIADIVQCDNSSVYVLTASSSEATPIYFYHISFDGSDFSASMNIKKLPGLSLNVKRRYICFSNRYTWQRVCVVPKQYGRCSFQFWQHKETEINVGDILNENIQTSLTRSTWCLSKEVKDDSELLCFHIAELPLSKESDLQDCRQIYQSLITAYLRNGTILQIDRLSESVVNKFALPTQLSDVVSQSLNGSIIMISHTFSGCMMILITSTGELCAFRNTPFPCDLTPNLLSFFVTMFEHLIILGADYWDLLVTIQQSHACSIMERLEERFKTQPSSSQIQYFVSFKFMLFFLHVIAMTGTAHSATMNSIDHVLKAMLYSSLCLCREHMRYFTHQWTAQKLPDYVSDILNTKHDNTIGEFLSSQNFIENEGSRASCLGVKRTLQWIVDLCFHLVVIFVTVSSDQYVESNMPGQSLISDSASLSSLRELLLYSKILNSMNKFIPGCPMPSRCQNKDIISDLYGFLSKLLLNLKDGSFGNVDENLLELGMSLQSELSLTLSNLSIPNPCDITWWHKERPRYFKANLLLHLNSNEPRELPYFDIINMFVIDTKVCSSFKVCLKCGLPTLNATEKSATVFPDIVARSTCACDGVFILTT